MRPIGELFAIAADALPRQFIQALGVVHLEAFAIQLLEIVEVDKAVTQLARRREEDHRLGACDDGRFGTIPRAQQSAPISLAKPARRGNLN
jgi:hypothetical protein